MNNSMSKSLKNKKNILLQLMKHRLSLMVAFSSVVGWFLFSRNITFGTVALFMGTFLVAGGASALNQFQEKELDDKMGRTQNRPLPAKLVSPKEALFIALSLIVTGTLLLLINSMVTAFLGLLNVVFYNLLYTKLKTKTQFAIIPGAVVGAIPPIMGWTAAGGIIFSPQIIFFAMFMFLWQMPHFWLLAIKYGKEYQKAGFSIVSNEMEESKIKGLILFWSVITSIYLLSFPVYFKETSIITVILLVILNILFIISFYRSLFGKKTEPKSLFKAFLIINSYAFLIMLLFVANAFI